MTASRQAREAAGYTLEQVARRINRSPRYLRELERRNSFTWALAGRLSRLYGTRMELFLPGAKTGRTMGGQSDRGGFSVQGESRPGAPTPRGTGGKP